MGFVTFSVNFELQNVFNPFQSSVAFHIETNPLIWRGSKMTGFYGKCNTGLKRYLVGSGHKIIVIDLCVFIDG